MIKQYIVVRKDLPMSSGKLAAQVSHASVAFLSWLISKYITKENDEYIVKEMKINNDIWEGWLNPEDASFTKVVLGVKNKHQLEKVVQKAKENGLIENQDYFCIRDEGRTELNNFRDDDGRIFTCVGFKPEDEEKMKPIVGKLQIYKN